MEFTEGHVRNNSFTSNVADTKI